MKNHVVQHGQAQWGQFLAKRARLGWEGLGWMAGGPESPSPNRSPDYFGLETPQVGTMGMHRKKWGEVRCDPPKKPPVFHFFYGRNYRKPLYNYRNRKAMGTKAHWPIEQLQHHPRSALETTKRSRGAVFCCVTMSLFRWTCHQNSHPEKLHHKCHDHGDKMSQILQIVMSYPMIHW